MKCGDSCNPPNSPRRSHRCYSHFIDERLQAGTWAQLGKKYMLRTWLKLCSSHLIFSFLLWGNKIIWGWAFFVHYVECCALRHPLCARGAARLYECWSSLIMYEWCCYIQPSWSDAITRENRNLYQEHTATLHRHPQEAGEGWHNHLPSIPGMPASLVQAP